MEDFFRQVLSTEGYHPHGFCYLWEPGLIWLHVVSDALIGLAYVAIGMALAVFVRRARGDFPFSRIFVAFGVFIAACGATHFVEIWTLWSPAYWFAGSVKLLTAAASVFTAIALPPLVPIALGTMRSARLSETRRVELEEAHERLMEAGELKTQFFANVSHELRTPLTLILAPVDQMLLDEELSPDGRERLQSVRRNADLLLKHVNDLLDVAKLEAGQMEPHYVRCDLASLLRLAASHFESAAESRAITLSVETPASVPGETDRDKFERILFNLIGNAVKFTPDGGRIRCVLSTDVPMHLAGARPEGNVRLEVHDSGPGISSKQRALIFEPFRQGDGGPARRYGGTGLGLAIVSDFTRLHHGTVRVGDSPLGGALFVVELPLRAPAGVEVLGEEAGTIPAPAGESAAPRAVVAPAPPRPARAGESLGPAGAPMVLVVEDNAEMSRFIAESLLRDYQVERAFDGEEGLRKAVELRPDLILSDIMMPGLSGEDLLREVRRIPSLDPVPVVLLSARADDELRIRLLHEGAQDYLTKPFFAAELRARVANWVAIKRARDVLQSELDTTLDDVEQLARSLATRKKELEAALLVARSAAAEAGAANRAKADFLSVMSHELRTPLNAVIGYLDLLQSGLGGELSEPQRRFVDRAKHSSDHLFGLVEQLLTYTRVEAGTERVLNEKIDLRTIVHDVTEMIEPLAAAKGLALSVVMPDDPLPMRTDPAKVRQILINLVENAVKFTNSGSVSVTLEGETERAVVTVHDTGGGILPEHLGRVFEPFWQADLSKTRIVGGTGLGLTISRRLTELLGGDIQVASEPGAGATFAVRLPTSPELGWMGGHGGARDRRMGKDRRATPQEGVPDER